MTAKVFAFHLRAINDDLHARMDAWAAAAFLDYVVYASNQQPQPRHVLLFAKTHPTAQIALSRGALTVQTKLGLDYLPERIHARVPFVENVLRQTAGGIPLPLYVRGEAFSAAALASGLRRSGRLLNPDHSMASLVAAGDLKVTDVGKIDMARSVVRSEAIMRAFSQKKDLEGELPVTFYKYNEAGERMPEGPTKETGLATTVVLNGLPGDTLSKRKHQWIWSRTGNRGKRDAREGICVCLTREGFSLSHPAGKTTTLRMALEPYKAVFISDPSNAVDVPWDAHIIVLDEVSPQKKPCETTLKAMTSGWASSGALNRKSYGASYVPRDDAQIIILSNHSPYEVYATWDPKSKIRRAKADVIGPLELRFNITRLDGDDFEEKVKWYDPANLTQEEYNRHVRDTFYDNLRPANSTGNCSTLLVKKVLTKLFGIHTARMNGQCITYVHVCQALFLAIPFEDYITVLNIVNEFAQPLYFPPKPATEEYNVHFRHDPRPNLYQELVDNMRFPQEVLPDFERRTERDYNGVLVRDAVYERRVRLAAETWKAQRQRQRQQPRVCHRNMHHRAQPHGTNTGRAPLGEEENIDAHLEAVMEAEEEYYVGPRSPDNDEMEAALAADAW